MTFLSTPVPRPLCYIVIAAIIAAVLVAVFQ